MIYVGEVAIQLSSYGLFLSWGLVLQILCYVLVGIFTFVCGRRILTASVAPSLS